MTQTTSRHSDKYIGTACIGFFGLIGWSIGSSYIPNAKSYGYEIVGVLLGFLGLFIFSMIQIKRLDKKQCSLGQHRPDKLQICEDCHKHLDGSEDLIDQHNREVEKNLSTKGGMTKFIVISIVPMILIVCYSYWMFTSTHADIIKGINNMDITDPTACRSLVEQQAMEQGLNGIMMGSHVVKATKQKFIEFDCIHKPIMDDLNKTCPIGVIPKIDGLNGFICYPGEEKTK